MKTDPLMDGFAILDRLSREEIESRVEWLENALAVYRMLLAVKNISQSKPIGIVPTWEAAAVVSAEPEKRKKLGHGEPKRRVREALERSASGLSIDEIMQLADMSRTSVTSELGRGSGTEYERIGYGRYSLVTNGNVEA
jgi:hypothetical protein